MSRHKPRWWPLLTTNFAGVFNDNFLKTLACFIAVGWVGAEYEGPLVSLAAGLLVVPYVFFSPLAGRWAVIFNKIWVVRSAKLAEIPIMMLASAGFLIKNVWMVMFSIFLMGVQSCLFSPSKYGLIRDIGGPERIAFGTGNMETVSFLGMILGTMLASFSAGTVSAMGLSVIFLFIALVGFLLSLTIKATESPTTKDEETLRPFLFFYRSAKKATHYKGLNPVIIALSVFWFVAGTVQMTLLVFCRRTLEMTNFQTGLVLTAAAVGTGGGCFLSGLVSKKWSKSIFVPLCSLGITLAFLAVYFFPIDGVWFGLLFFVTGILCGLYKVPFDAAILGKVPGRNLGPMLAYANQMSFLFILAASGVFALITKFGSSRDVFLFLGGVMGLTTVFVVFSKYLWSPNHWL
ncbi:MAG: MFS transporter [Bacteroidales bacterium]|nr:MFS transporter [Bacteroidales bacterium]